MGFRESYLRLDLRPENLFPSLCDEGQRLLKATSAGLNTALRASCYYPVKAAVVSWHYLVVRLRMALRFAGICVKELGDNSIAFSEWLARACRPHLEGFYAARAKSVSLPKTFEKHVERFDALSRTLDQSG